MYKDLSTLDVLKIKKKAQDSVWLECVEGWHVLLRHCVREVPLGNYTAMQLQGIGCVF